VHRGRSAGRTGRAPARARARPPADVGNARRVEPRELRVPVDRRDRAHRRPPGAHRRPRPPL
jgi:hypothetical protein